MLLDLRNYKKEECNVSINRGMAPIYTLGTPDLNEQMVAVVTCSDSSSFTVDKSGVDYGTE